MKNINETMRELAEMTAMLEETKAIIEGLQEEVKAYMTAEGVDEVLTATGEKATWREVISSRFDSTSFKKISWTSIKNIQRKPHTSALLSQHEKSKGDEKSPLWFNVCGY